MMTNVEQLKEELLYKEITLNELDEIMTKKYNACSETDNDEIIESCLNDGCVNYVIPNEDNISNSYILFDFEVTIKASEDEYIGATYIKITNICEN